MKAARVALALAFLEAPFAFSQTPTSVPDAPFGAPLVAHEKEIYGGVKRILLRAADKMPEEQYSFRPTEAVRAFGQIIGHIADSQYFFCSLALGETNPSTKIEKTKTSKAELVAALKEAFAYCDRAYGAMTEATAIRTVPLFGGETPKLGVLGVNSLHSVEHYGNLVTYMRMKGIVPPTSEPALQPEVKK